MKRASTWKVVGNGPKTRINECRRSNDEQVVKYEDAKTEALNRLESFVAPYLERIEQLKRKRTPEPLLTAPVRWRICRNPQTKEYARWLVDPIR